MNYLDRYKLRLNHDGYDYQARMQTKRERLFDLYLKRSVYRIHFDYDNEDRVGSFEKYKQDETESLHYLLTYVDVNIDNQILTYFSNGKPVLIAYWYQHDADRIKTGI